ncbi:MAG: ATP-binding protein [Bacteroidales bacterium]
MNAGSAVAAFGILILALLWVGLAWDLGREREHVLAQAEADNANLARAFQEHIRRTIAGLDQALVYVESAYEDDPANFRLKDMVARSIVLRNVSVQLAIIGPDGVLADSTVPGFTPVDLSDREHFQVHKAAANDRLFISKPVLGRASGRWSIQMTRRLDKPDGSFGGVVVLSLDPQYLSDFYGSIDVGSRGAILLVGRDGIIRAASDGSVGRELPAAAVQPLFASNGGGSQRLIGPLDDERRIASFRAMNDLSLAVWVGRSQNDVLIGHADTVRAYLLVGVGVTAVLGGALLLLYKLVRRQEAIARDLQLKKAELLSSRERLRRYVADLERIAEVAAHDLQEPLRRVVAYAQLLSSHAQNALDAESRDYVAHVVSGAQRMRKLVQDLEAFVAVDHLPSADCVVSPTGPFNAATASLADDIRRSGATVLVDALPSVAADERSLTEIFTQLLDNALRYRSPERKPLIHVSARREEGFAVFSVRDNGQGIEERYLPRVFEIFHRLQTVDGQTGTGTGIGLAIVRRMVERLGGRVWVDSTAGQGSSFSFTLPLTVPMAAANSSDQGVQAA